VSEKEQAESLKLLHAWLSLFKLPAAPAHAGDGPPPDELPDAGKLASLIERTDKFLALSVPAPESHGQRRS